MTKITIPREALKAAARAIEEADKRAIEEADIGMLPSYEEAARAACLAMLKAWPGGSAELSDKGNPYIILPLTENSNEQE